MIGDQRKDAHLGQVVYADATVRVRIWNLAHAYSQSRYIYFLTKSLSLDVGLEDFLTQSSCLVKEV